MHICIRKGNDPVKPKEKPPKALEKPESPDPNQRPPNPEKPKDPDPLKKDHKRPVSLVEKPPNPVQTKKFRAV